jgi:signal transduction histidine kinase
MGGRSSAGGKPNETRRRKAATLKRRDRLKTVRRRRRSSAGLETEVARLTQELNEAREQQAATSEVLRVISRSEFDLRTVLESLVEKAVRVCGAEQSMIWRQEGGLYRVAASYGHSIEFLERVATRNPIHPDRRSAMGRAVLERHSIHIHDTLADPEYSWGKDHRGEEQMLNNFSAVSVELIGELREALGGVHVDSALRAEISEIADTLQGNLDKVVQHGKRADAIVKNMLLHSRQGSGERRPVDINALVEESLNLAYHGARAEKQGFTITLERSFDPAAGEVDLFPQEITRALLNLISNGFYAATKRKAEANGGDYEPTLTATTKNLGDSIEIRIRDNGTGIPPEVKEKLFSPFFTTKPAGEGTGLGLSISHDIIVKQHGGSIEVDTQPGEFTEFRIVLPRAVACLMKSGGRA